MKAIIISSYGGPEVLTVTELPDPVPAAGEGLIAVRAFGLNHAEAYMRSGVFGEVAKVTGIECAGTVVADPGGRLLREPRWSPSSAAWDGPGTAAMPSLSPCPPATWSRSAHRCRGPTWSPCPRCTRLRGLACARTLTCVLVRPS